jgi:hypothetical protein
MMKPKWLVKGALIKFAWYVGQVVDIAVSDERVMVLVASLKEVWRHHDAEWLEYHPGMIELATPDDVQRDIEKYQAHIQKTFDVFETLRVQWQSILHTSPPRIESPGISQ